MNRLFALTSMLAVAIIASTTGARADDKDVSIKDIMTKAHKGGDAILKKAGAAAKDKDFDKLSDNAKELVKLGKDLGKAKPPKGDEKSWKKLTGTYLKDAESLEKAAKDKDAEAAGKSLNGLNTSCKACHTAHRGK
jgi:cytochrome c556